MYLSDAYGLCDFMDFVGRKETCYDDNGHGTHVSGILTAADIGMAAGAG